MLAFIMHHFDAILLAAALTMIGVWAWVLICYIRSMPRINK